MSQDKSLGFFPYSGTLTTVVGMDTELIALEPTNTASSPENTNTRFSALCARICSRHMLNIAILMLLPVVMTQPMRMPSELVRDPDVWWHLANASILTSTHHFIRVEPYAFTVAGQRWIAPEWLAELPLWAFYRAFHLTGLYLVTWLGLSANVIFVYLRAFWKTRHSGAAFWAAGLSFCLMTISCGPRTILFAYLAFAAELVILDAVESGRSRMAWLLPPLFCVWVNLHGSWLIGLALLGLYILCGAFGFTKGALEQPGRSWDENRRLLYVLLTCAAALMVNPYGWRMVWNPIDMLLNMKLSVASVVEWQPMRLDWFVGKASLACILMMLLANLVRDRKWKLYEISFIVFAWYAAFSHIRFAFLAGVIIAPFLAVDFVRSFCEHSDAKTIPVMNALMTVGVACLVIHFFPGEAALERGFAEVFPVQTIASIDPSWRTLNAANIGGVMALEAKPDYIDPRMDTFELHGIVAKYLDTMWIQRPLEILDEDRIDHVLFLEHTPLVYLLKHTAGWSVVRREGQGDDAYILLAKTPIGYSEKTK